MFVFCPQKYIHDWKCFIKACKGQNNYNINPEIKDNDINVNGKQYSTEYVQKKFKWSKIS